MFESPEDGELKIQWRVEATDGKEDESRKEKRKSRDNARKTFRKELDCREYVLKAVRQKQPTGYVVGIDFRDIPTSKKDLGRLADEVSLFVNSRILEGVTPSRFDVRYIGTSDLLGKFVIEIEIDRWDKVNQPTEVICSPPAHRVLPSDERARPAIEAKSKLYGKSAHDLVLVIEFDFDPSEDWEIQRLKTSLAGELFLFREIWTFCHGATDSLKAQLVWPLPVNGVH